jgi:hypothetical protein
MALARGNSGDLAMSPLMNAAPAGMPAASPTSNNAPPADARAANITGRPVEGRTMIFIPAAGLPVGSQQTDKIGFDRTGPSTTLYATVTRQSDGKWLTQIAVPYGEQRGGDAIRGTDLSTTLTFISKDQPTLNQRGQLQVSGQRIDGNFLESRLHGLKLPLPDYTNFRYGGPED